MHMVWSVLLCLSEYKQTDQGKGWEDAVSLLLAPGYKAGMILIHQFLSVIQHRHINVTTEVLIEAVCVGPSTDKYRTHFWPINMFI